MDDGELGPFLYPTDFGACCLFTPHLNMEPTDWNLTFAEMYHDLVANALNVQRQRLPNSA